MRRRLLNGVGRACVLVTDARRLFCPFGFGRFGIWQTFSTTIAASVIAPVCVYYSCRHHTISENVRGYYERKGGEQHIGDEAAGSKTADYAEQ